MSSSRGSEENRGNTNEDDNEDDNDDSTEERGGEQYMHDQHAAVKDEEQRGEGRSQHPPGVCSRPYLGEQQHRSVMNVRCLLSILVHAMGAAHRAYLPCRAGANLESHG